MSVVIHVVLANKCKDIVKWSKERNLLTIKTGNYLKSGATELSGRVIPDEWL